MDTGYARYTDRRGGWKSCVQPCRSRDAAIGHCGVPTESLRAATACIRGCASSRRLAAPIEGNQWHPWSFAPCCLLVPPRLIHHR
eukprot:1702219-Prymnesium_polylepis.1